MGEEQTSYNLKLTSFQLLSFLPTKNKQELEIKSAVVSPALALQQLINQENNNGSGEEKSREEDDKQVSYSKFRQKEYVYLPLSRALLLFSFFWESIQPIGGCRIFSEGACGPSLPSEGWHVENLFLSVFFYLFLVTHA